MSNLHSVLHLLLLSALLGHASAWAQGPAAENTVIIRERAGLTTTDYPVQIGRPFRQGEIAQYPQAVVAGTAVTTQADVKQRWPDGTVRHAVLTFLLPQLGSGQSVTVAFRNQATGNNTGFLSVNGMLAQSFGFDASMRLTGSGSASASARAMLTAGAYRYWLQGAVATSVIIADHSTARAFDLGFDTDRPFRPIFHATFFPSINKVRVRFIGETSNTAAWEDITYALALQLGTSGNTVFTQATLPHHAGARWTKEFWIGGAPPAADIDHNLTYLAATTALPNYDTGKSVSDADISSEYAAWTSAPRALLQEGNWTKAMGGTGGRRDIGMYPAWTVRWLYTGDHRMREMAFGNADLAGAWPMHFREGSPGRNFVRDSPDGAALGRVVSLTARPTIFTYAGNNYLNAGFTTAADKFNTTGTVTNQGWQPDGAHQPDPFSPQYLLSGDYFYLEQMWFWASWGATTANPGDASWGRGPHGSFGHLADQARGEAWMLRNRIHAILCSPDDALEKVYFSKLLEDTLDAWEGMRNIPSPRSSSTMWQWGRSRMTQKYGDALGGPSPLRVWSDPGGGFVQDPIDPNNVAAAYSPWEQHMVLMVLGRAVELGHRADTLLEWLGPALVEQLTTPGFRPELAASYRMPAVRKLNHTYYTSWLEVAGGFLPSYDAVASFDYNNNDPEHGYTYMMMAAMSYLTELPKGRQAWEFVAVRALTHPALNRNPKWALLPRGLPRAPRNLRP